MPKKRERSKFHRPLSEGSKVSDVFPNDPAVYITIRKTADETVNNSATLQNDDDLFFRAAPNDIWEVEYVLRYTAATTADFSWGISLPSSATFRGVANQLASGAAAATDDLLSANTQSGGNPGALGTGTEAGLWIKGIVDVSGTGGLVNFQWSQRVAEVSDTVLKAGSYMNARKIS